MKSELLLKTLNIRNFENALLELFPKGLVKGTTHTSLGQETNAVGIISALQSDDIVVSNHRCHGHYLSHTDDYTGLLNEILGKDNGVCGGIGGSQHLFYKNKFFSNGILGGNTAMAAGMAYALKFKKMKKIVCLFVGDGTLGQGIFYETLNLIGKNKLPILIVVEDNEIAQSTKTKDVLPGEIPTKIASFDIETISIEYPHLFEVNDLSKNIINKIRNKNRPYCLVIKSNRMGPHSKGDDTRSKEELTSIINNDTLNKSIKEFKDNNKIDELKKTSSKFIEKIFKNCLNENIDKNINLENRIISKKNNVINTKNILSKIHNKRFSEIINSNLLDLFKNNEKMIMIGEDILDPYSGAFKITKGLSKNFPSRVYSSPICEAGIIGFATGMAMKGLKPIVEIMFGDFLGLGFDQILNNACKFRKMYNNQIDVPLIIRTPMGGKRGYGPTHSQSIEKHFFGIEGLNIYALNPFQDIDELYISVLKNKEPTLIIENKVDYNFIAKKINDDIYDDFKVKHSLLDDDFTVSFSLTNFNEDEGTIICYGGMLNDSLKAVKKYFLEEEISYRVVSIGKIHPLNMKSIILNITDNGKIICVEENTSNYGMGSEICFELFKLNKFDFIDKIGAKNALIPSSFNKEKLILLDDEMIFNYLKKIN